MTTCSRCMEEIEEKQHSNRAYKRGHSVYCIRCYHVVEKWRNEGDTKYE